MIIKLSHFRMKFNLVIKKRVKITKIMRKEYRKRNSKLYFFTKNQQKIKKIQIWIFFIICTRRSIKSYNMNEKSIKAQKRTKTIGKEEIFHTNWLRKIYQLTWKRIWVRNVKFSKNNPNIRELRNSYQYIKRTNIRRIDVKSSENQ